MKLLGILLYFLTINGLLGGDAIKIASLHPLLGNMARQIGGEYVDVTDMLKPNGNLHAFEPNPQDIARARGARIILASGKNLEPYLDSLRDAFKNSNPPCILLDLGSKIPDVPAMANNNRHDHGGHDCDCGSHGPNDPHWWHTPSNMKRAARQLASVLAGMDESHARQYKENLTGWIKKMDSLDAWARVELSKIPENKRIIAVGHAAMNHFCTEYGFKEIHIQGISREDESNPAKMAALMKQIREEKVPVIFPEYSSTPKALEQISNALKIPLGKPLITDGLAPDASDFEAMFRKNVQTIVGELVKLSK